MKVLKIPPELVDGDHWTVMKPVELQGASPLMDSLRYFTEHSDTGDTVTLEVVEMTQEEFDALPDI